MRASCAGPSPCAASRRTQTSMRAIDERRAQPPRPSRASSSRSTSTLRRRSRQRLASVTCARSPREQLDLRVLGREPERAQRRRRARGSRAARYARRAASSARSRRRCAQSKSRPPRKLSPSWPTTRSRPSRVSSSDASNVPPPRSNTSHVPPPSSLRAPARRERRGDRLLEQLDPLEARRAAPPPRWPRSAAARTAPAPRSPRARATNRAAPRCPARSAFSTSADELLGLLRRPGGRELDRLRRCPSAA